MSRDGCIRRALAYFDDGHYVLDLARRVAIPSESQNPDRLPDLARYLAEEMVPAFEAMGFACRVFDNPIEGGGPVLLAQSMEDEALPTVLGYGHGDGKARIGRNHPICLRSDPGPGRSNDFGAVDLANPCPLGWDRQRLGRGDPGGVIEAGVAID